MLINYLGLSRLNTPSILCLGAHSDDIEIGALATIVLIAENFSSANVTWVVFGAHGDRADEALRSADHCTKGFASAAIEVLSFRDGHFPAQSTIIKEQFETLKQRHSPDLIFTHYRSDAHQDHRTISEMTYQTFRDHLILEYEIPKYDGDIGRPNVYSAVSKKHLEQKLDVLNHYFESQNDRSWFTPDTFMSLMRLRGIECNSPSGYAEAFHCKKLRIIS